MNTYYAKKHLNLILNEFFDSLPPIILINKV
jgi:hypothetical protein